MFDFSKKRFPADLSLDVQTFLNDKKINGELYACLQGVSDFSVIDQKLNLFQTFVLKSKMPKKKELCEKLGINSTKTLNAHLKYLEERGFIISGDGSNDIIYYLPEMEEFYFLIPLPTLQYLNDNCREHVLKLYIYLGSRYKWALSSGKQYEFTLEELAEHIGIKVKNYSRGYQVINNALDLLVNSGLIKYVSCYENGVAFKRLTGFSFTHKSTF